MELIRRGKRRSASSLPTTTLLFCASLCFFSTSALFLTNFNENSSPNRGKSSRMVGLFIQGKAMRELGGPGGGPGSYPPRCTLKCAGCSPCCPIHVPVPPGTPVIAEYYPEAWRCKCGNKLFMP